MNEMNELMKILPFALPIILIHWILVIISLVDLVKRRKVRFNNKVIWALIIVLIEIIGPVVYLLAKGDEE
jgi:hypothetical protein